MARNQSQRSYISWIAYFPVTLLLCSYFILPCCGYLYYDTDNETNLLEWVRRAEMSLRIFIYAIPNSNLNNSVLRKNQNKIPYHFLVEQLFPEYLKTIRKNKHRYRTKDPRKYLIVDDPEKANAFIIDHHWITRAELYPNCSEFFKKHMHPVINTVADNYPYLNQSNGRNHFMMAVHDNGAFSTKFPYAPCFQKNDNLDSIWNRKVFNRIRNISFITNTARNTISTSRKHWFDKVLFIPNQDISIPQLLHPQRWAESKLPWLVNRQFDSSFAGSTWGDRLPLLAIANTSEEDYYEKATERAIFKLKKAVLQKGLFTNFTEHGYFAYNPCGVGHCWSMRLFDGMVTNTIPVLSGNDIIMPFEKFINWRNLSIKMSAETWHNETGQLDRFRATMRMHADNFRSKLFKFWKSIGIDELSETRMKSEFLNGELDDNSKLLLEDLKKTLIWKKMEFINSAKQWFYFDQFTSDNIPLKHPFKLLQLEMWCRVTDLKAREKEFGRRILNDLCARPSNLIAKEEYFL